MFDLPLDQNITLEDTQAFHETLLASGAPINEINTLRKHFSSVKGGRLAMAAPEAAKISFLLPDVPLRSLDSLSSGPSSPDHSTVADVRTILEKYELAAKLPSRVRTFFEREDLPESPGNKRWTPSFLPKLASAVRARRITAASMKDEDDAFRESVCAAIARDDDMVLAAQGKSDWEIGRLLGISESTVHKHIEDAKRRFGVSTRIQLVVRGLAEARLSFSDILGGKS